MLCFRLRWAARSFTALLLTLLWCAAWDVGASAATNDSCHPEQLRAARTTAVLRVAALDHTYVQASGVMTVRVPVAWAYAEDLLLSPASDDYAHAMRCLLRDENRNRQYHRTEEFRPQGPQVTVERDWVWVRYQTLSWMNRRGAFRNGPWSITVGPARWQVALTPPTALGGARWEDVEISLGGLDAYKVSPRPLAGQNGVLRWAQPVLRSSAPGAGVLVQVAPPWPRAAAASVATEPWKTINAVGVTTWWVGASGAVVVAALRARTQPVGAQLTRLERSSSRALLRWGLLSAVVGVAVLLLFRGIAYTAHAVTGESGWWNYEQRWPILIGAVAGWAMVFTAGPRASVLFACSLAALAAGLVAAAPGLFGLSPGLVPDGAAPAGAIAALAVAAAALLWLWLSGVTLWAWFLAREGGMLRPSAQPWRLRRMGAVLSAVVLAMLGWSLLAEGRTWQRASWLSDRSLPSFHTRRLLDEAGSLAAFAAQVPAWWYALTWVLTGIAVLALLRARDLSQPARYANPTRLDALLLAVFFAVAVAFRQGAYAGSQALASLWLVTDIVAVYGLLAVGRRWAVLAQHFEGVGSSPELQEAITEEARSDLIQRARRYRELVAQLRRAEEGDVGGVGDPQQAEKELRRLHRWGKIGQTDDSECPTLPSNVTVVDVALSWGPHAAWWDNARHAAMLAGAFGVPASLIMVYTTYEPQQLWMLTQEAPFGAAEIVRAFLSWEIAWAGAGLLLGALWRTLPGRRGPERALSLEIAYALVAALGLLGVRLTHQEVGNAALATCLMFLVLTGTGLAMDVATFRTERRFWSSRSGMLLSIYQMRGFSVQIAYLTAQLMALLTIWKFFNGNEFRGIKPP